MRSATTRVAREAATVTDARRARGVVPRRRRRSVGPGDGQRPLYRATDNGAGISILPRLFGGSDLEGWGRCFDSFLRLNETAFKALAVTSRFESTPRGPELTLYPGGSVGAIPLKSGTTGQTVAGFIVRPRFGWPGVGSILAQLGWHAAPNLLSMPLVPGSGREVPPWVIAGPVLSRLQALLDTLKRGFDFRIETLRSPRGTIVWSKYLHESLPRGKWHHVVSRFPDLSTDPVLRGAIRWTLERVLRELTLVGGADRIALGLEHNAVRMLNELGDVAAVYPRPQILRQLGRGDPLVRETVRNGLDAIGWVRDERGLGGGRQMDGLAWTLGLDALWESYVEYQVREEVRRTGGTLRSGRLRETVTPLRWSDATHRSLGHLTPDIVVVRGRSVRIVDAKYKSHFAEIDESGWHRMADELRESHRADLHQVLAYTSLFDAEEITATLAYPLRQQTWLALKARGLERSTADVYQGTRHIRLELWGLPFAAGAQSK